MGIEPKIQLLTCPDPELIDKELSEFIFSDVSVYRKQMRDLISGRVIVLQNDLDVENYNAGVEKVREITFKWSKLLGERFNKRFGLSLNEKSWRFVLFPFLWNFVASVYLKYKKFQNIWDKNLVLSFRSIDTICKTNGETGNLLATSYEYNAAIWADIFRYFGKELQEIEPRRSDDIDQREQQEKVSSINRYMERGVRLTKLLMEQPREVLLELGKRLRDVLLYRGKKIEVCDLRDGVGLVDSRMPKEFEREFVRRSKGEIQIIDKELFGYEPDCLKGEIAIDIDGRAAFFSGLSFEDEFESLLLDIIPKYLPASHFEGVSDYYQRAVQLCQSCNYKKIYHCAFNSELFQFVCAVLSGKNTLICEIQHAGGNSARYYAGWEEYYCFDRFLTWGWERKEGLPGNIRAVAMNRLPIKPWYKVRKKDKILLISLTAPVWANDSLMGQDWTDYFSRQMEFIDNLPEKLRKKIVIRTEMDETESDFFIECKKKYPYITFERVADRTITESLLESLFVICDYYGTTHMEAIMLGCPFAMYDGVKIVKYNPVLPPYLDKMKKAGIYRENGAELAEEIAKHEDYSKWLMAPEQKKVIEEYKSAVMGTDKSLFDAWYQELIGD